ncbi:MAG: rhomboid family intramembrane serine protease, partial [Gaiellales bacterium]
MTTCYRHPDRETSVACSNCGRPICPECMTHAAVGIRCPECAHGRARLSAAGFLGARDPWLTYGLIAVNVALFLATNRLGGGGGGLMAGSSINSLGRDMAVYAGGIRDGQYYRLITAAFLHFGPLHLAFNMYALYLLGGVLERYAGAVRFGAIYFTSALAGSFGALLISPDAFTGGASGAIFGLMGALFVLERQRGIALLGSSIGGLLVINLGLTFALSNQISVGGHVGGLIGG